MYMKKNACTCLFIKSLQLLIAKDLLFVCGIILTGILLRVKWENEINTTYPHWLLKNCQQQKFICLKQISSAQTENLEVRCREARTTFPQLECCQCTVVAAHPNSNGSQEAAHSPWPSERLSDSRKRSRSVWSRICSS